MTEAAEQHKTRQNRLRKPQTGQKSSYPARVAKVVAGLFESFRTVRRQPSPYIQIVQPGDEPGGNLGDSDTSLSLLSSLSRMSLNAA
ncbi:hypothetical protein L596_011537 [Steinernema carpocapsae]|uniref:Uncharacterized protein n=1 Tax=Steinernema carpocapsae TaxID=34508 RepID=A0A4U5NV51_STECR|nr:hypothetical protein L596_011537 [Steinernema carpocapsae]